MNSDKAEATWDRTANHLNTGYYEKIVVNDMRGPITDLARSAGGGPIQIALMEEILIWHIVAIRLLRAVGNCNALLTGKEDLGNQRRGVLATLDALAKARERYRKAMKELNEYDGGVKKGGGLASEMLPILEEAEGILEDAIEFEARKKSNAKKRDKARAESTLAKST